MKIRTAVMAAVCAFGLYSCSDDGTSVNTCEELSANPKCELIEKKCLAGSESNCSFWIIYVCLVFNM